jgi:1,2-diacylglycerol 3-alpha-glucosyltransferase
MNSEIPKVFFVCPGIGHIHRGYETFTRQCFDALKSEKQIRSRLFKGAGTNDELETTIPILRRTRLIARLAGRAVFRNGYDIEQLSFAIGLIPFLRREQPNVVFFSDRELGLLLWHWRKRSSAKFKLLFSNGSPASPPFDRWDHVHQVSPEHYQTALSAGVKPEKQSLIPYGYEVPKTDAILVPEEKRALRVQLGLPADRGIALSVGAVSSVHKRMDYVVREIASMSFPRPFLLLVGQTTGSDTQKILALADTLLGQDGYRFIGVPPEKIGDFYKSSDFFVLASLKEGFGRVLLEAMSFGLPCIVHDHATARYILGKDGYFGDLREKGTLAANINQILKIKEDLGTRIARNREIQNRFSWNSLSPHYLDMLCRVASGKGSNPSALYLEERVGLTSSVAN